MKRNEGSGRLQETKKLGFVGLGVMGRPMARNLMRAGYELVVHNRSRAAVEELAAEGAGTAASPAEVAGLCDTVVLMLPDSPDVEGVMLGEGGVLEGTRPGSIVVDMSSISPLTARKVAGAAREKDLRYVDAPVSGGEPKAVDGTLSIMAGSDTEEDFEEIRPLLSVMGSSVIRVGVVGAGNVVKLANQVMVALNIAALSEALELGAKSGADPELVFEAVREGLAGSNALEAKAPLIMDRRFEPGFRIDLHAKDLANALEAGHASGAPLPLTAFVMEVMQNLKAKGLGGLDHGALVRFYEELGGTEVKRSGAGEAVASATGEEG